jgi:hypothetical protein
MRQINLQDIDINNDITTPYKILTKITKVIEGYFSCNFEQIFCGTKIKKDYFRIVKVFCYLAYHIGDCSDSMIANYLREYYNYSYSRCSITYNRNCITNGETIPYLSTLKMACIDKLIEKKYTATIPIAELKIIYDILKKYLV